MCWHCFILSYAAHQLRNFLIEAYAPNAPRTCVTVGTPVREGWIMSYVCNHDTKGRNVRIRLIEPTVPLLQLAEVEVFGELGKITLVAIMHAYQQYYDVPCAMCTIWMKIGEQQTPLASQDIISNLVDYVNLYYT